MARKRFNIAVSVLICLLAIPIAAAQRREPARRNRPTVPPQTIQPVGPCRFSYSGRWFGDDQIRYEVEQEAGRLTWLAPALGAQARGGCEGNVVWMARSGPLGEGMVRGTAEGHPGGPALLIRWSDGRRFARIPDLSIAANKDSVHKGEPVEFVAKIDPPDSPVSRYFINFGDGQENYFEPFSTSHVYQSSGVFNVVLTAILFDERFPSPPVQVRVVDDSVVPPLSLSFRLEVDRRRALVGEELRFRGVLEPEVPGAVYSFSFGGQTSPWLSSPNYAFRCDSAGSQIARATVRFAAVSLPPIDSEPIEIAVIVPPEPPVPTDGGWLVWVIPSVIVVGLAALTCRRLYKKGKEREQARWRERVEFEKHLDPGNQALSPDPERLYRTELLLKPAIDIGKQRAYGLSIVKERREQ